jgi:hypothetical protein
MGITGEGNLRREGFELELEDYWSSPFETPPRRKHNHSFLLSNFTVQQHNDYKNIFLGIAHLSRTPWT